MVKVNNIYETYHLKRNIQNHTISDNDFTYRPLLSFLKKYNKLGFEILDIGCGVGTIDLYLAKKDHKVIGIDISKRGIEIAKKNAQKLSLYVNLKFLVKNFPQSLPSGKFDLIICSEVLEHLKDDRSAVNAISKLLKRDGIVIASSPSKNAPLYKWGALSRFDQEVGHLRRYTKGGFIKLFKESKFKVIETKEAEGLLRNFLFTNLFGGLLLRLFNKWPFSEIITFIDSALIPIFGESDIYLVAKKL